MARYESPLFEHWERWQSVAITSSLLLLGIHGFDSAEEPAEVCGGLGKKLLQLIDDSFQWFTILDNDYIIMFLLGGWKK